MSNVNIYNELAQKVCNHYRYKNAELGFLKSINGRPNENFVMITLMDPCKSECPNKVSAMFLNTANGLKVVKYFMSKFYLFQVTEEERALYPENYSVYQDEQYAYVTTDMPEDISSISKLFKVFNTFESILLSEKTHCRYEKISDYIKNYNMLGAAIEECIKNSEDAKTVEQFKKDYTYEKKIIEPLATACSILLNKVNFIYTQKITSYGNFVVLRFSNPNDAEETGICLLISDEHGNISVRKATGISSAGGYDTVELPNNVCEILNFMQTKKKASV